MITSRLPATPRDALSMSPLLKFIVNILLKGADIFGYWKYPDKKASADFEDWSLLQKIAWIYKSRHPIVNPEKDSGLEEYFKNCPRTIALPTGFKKKSSITLAAVGDLYKADGLENSKDLLYEDAAQLIFGKDITYANLESQLTKQEFGKIIFNKNETPPLCSTNEQYAALRGHKRKKFTVLHTANNHTLDMGLEGVETTLERLKKEGIIDLGTNRQEADRQKGRIIEKKGMKIGFAAATFGLNGKAVPAGKEYIVNVVKFHKRTGAPDLSLLLNQIEYCRGQGCDFVIASLHWGYEYELYPRLHQVGIAHELIESGADIIIGHHAHVIQPVEYYRTRRDPDRLAAIAYCLGNLTTSFSAPHLVLSHVLDLKITRGVFKNQEKTYIEKVNIIPVMQVESELGGVPVIRIKNFLDMLQQVIKNKK